MLGQWTGPTQVSWSFHALVSADALPLVTLEDGSTCSPRVNPRDPDPRRFSTQEAAMSKKKKPGKIERPKGPCEPSPPKRPPSPSPSQPWDKLGGPDPLKWLKLGKKK